MGVMDEIAGARRRIRRNLTWAETDAAGHNHFSAAVRWLEEGEHDLWRSLGLVEIIPAVPRVHLDIDYRDRIFFGDTIEVTTGIVRVGTTSATFATAISHVDADGNPTTLAIECRHIVAHCPDPRGHAQPWPDAVRNLLLTPNG